MTDIEEVKKVRIPNPSQGELDMIKLNRAGISQQDVLLALVKKGSTLRKLRRRIRNVLK